MSEAGLAEAKARRAARGIAMHDAATAGSLMLYAELAVLRRFVSAQLPRDEVEYWELVEQELPR